jgi:nitrogen fixation protein NifX
MSAVRRLRVIDVGEESPSTTEALRVAIATDDMRSLNAHFGSARKFAIYHVTRDGWSLVESVAFDVVSDGSGTHAREGEDRITAKVEALSGCHLLVCLAIGGPSAAKVIAARIHPIKVAGPLPIDDVLDRARTMLRGTPPPWLRKILMRDKRADPAEFADE